MKYFTVRDLIKGTNAPYLKDDLGRPVLEGQTKLGNAKKQFVLVECNRKSVPLKSDKEYAIDKIWPEIKRVRLNKILEDIPYDDKGTIAVNEKTLKTLEKFLSYATSKDSLKWDNKEGKTVSLSPKDIKAIIRQDAEKEQKYLRASWALKEKLQELDVKELLDLNVGNALQGSVI